MRIEQDVERFLNVVAKERVYPNKENLRFYLNTLFEGVDFNNKRVLDIGGGTGLYSLWAICMGAKKAVCLEPELEGSSSGVGEKFWKLKSLLQFDNVVLQRKTFQSFEPDSETFDIILLHNSINHLDEIATINLLKDESSQAIYIDLFSKIYLLQSEGGKLIICDCSRYNVFPLLKIRNPFAPTIEWHKHQAPELWANLLGKVGFVNPKIRWLSFNRLRWWGKVILGNRLISYFLHSHFCLTMDKP
jgi:SAM-dependent methyltransferase